MYCRNCGSELNDNAAVCLKCGVAVKNGKKYCSNCGNEVGEGASVCISCGAAITPSVDPSQQKSKVVAGVLGIFLGSLGIHNFYLEKTKIAIIQLIVSIVGGILTCGIATVGVQIWGFVEGIMILTGSFNVDGKGNPLKD